jgi:hypothetical protein
VLPRLELEGNVDELLGHEPQTVALQNETVLGGSIQAGARLGNKGEERRVKKGAGMVV